MLSKIINYSKLALISDVIFKSAKASGNFSGIEFGEFGRRIGRQILFQLPNCGIEYLIAPVNSVRYFEFPFVESCITDNALNCLDISSPRLFSLYCADKKPATKIRIINPDVADYKTTLKMLEALHLTNVSAENIDLKKISQDEHYDFIWSISVIEHISGDYNDTDAIKMMYALLKEGGKLILTFPVDRVFRNEYISNNAYGLSVDQIEEKYFFQRYYDYSSIVSRLLDPIGAKNVHMSWFGETTEGYFANYETEWKKDGIKKLVNDPIEMIRNFAEYPTWDAMPGMGVCGLMIEKS